MKQYFQINQELFIYAVFTLFCSFVIIVLQHPAFRRVDYNLSMFLLLLAFGRATIFRSTFANAITNVVLIYVLSITVYVTIYVVNNSKYAYQPIGFVDGVDGLLLIVPLYSMAFVQAFLQALWPIIYRIVEKRENGVRS